MRKKDAKDKKPPNNTNLHIDGEFVAIEQQDTAEPAGLRLGAPRLAGRLDAIERGRERRECEQTQTNHRPGA